VLFFASGANCASHVLGVEFDAVGPGLEVGLDHELARFLAGHDDGAECEHASVHRGVP